MPDEWDIFISSSKQHPKLFDIIKIDQSMQEAVEPYFKHFVKKEVKLKGFRMFKIKTSSSLVFVGDNYSGAWHMVAVRNKKRFETT